MQDRKNEWLSAVSPLNSSRSYVPVSFCSCSCSVSQLCPTLCDPMDCSTPGLPVLHHLPELAQIHVHWVGDAIQHPTLVPFSCLQSFPPSGSLPVSWLFTPGGQSIGASASAPVLPMNILDWFSLGLTGLISMLSKGLSSVFSNVTVQEHQLFGTQPSLWSNSHIHTWLDENHSFGFHLENWKNHSFDYMDLCQQSNDSAF